jgi:hypothetical protein
VLLFIDDWTYRMVVPSYHTTINSSSSGKVNGKYEKIFIFFRSGSIVNKGIVIFFKKKFVLGFDY